MYIFSYASQKSEANFSLLVELPIVLTDDELACLRSLSFKEILTRENNIEPASKETGYWLLESADFQSWAQRKRLDEHNGFFWIKWSPGSGKSTMILKAHSVDPSSMLAAFFFNFSGSEVEKSPTGLFRTLLHMLCQRMPVFRALVVEKYVEKSRLLQPGWEWHFSELKALLKSIVTAYILGQRNLVLFVDALDECEFDGAKLVIQFFEELASSAISEGTKFNVCLSSRYVPQFTIRNYFETQLENENQGDIAAFIHDSMASAKAGEGTLDYMATMQNEILCRASSIFLWVVLVVQKLLDADNAGGMIRELGEILRKIPSDLDGLYHYLLQSTEDEDCQQFLRLIAFVLFVGRPLSLTELWHVWTFGYEGFTSYTEWS